MSEPYSALLQAELSEPQLRAYLGAKAVGPRKWIDWPLLGGRWYDFSYDRDLPRVLGAVEADLGSRTYRELLRAFVDSAEHPRLGRFEYESGSRMLVAGNLTFTENLTRLIWFLTLARGVASYLEGPQTGFAMVHNYLWGRERTTVAVLALDRLGSRFANNAKDVEVYESSIRQGTAVFDDIMQNAERGAGVRRRPATVKDL